jgi:hypothetical protein
MEDTLNKNEYAILDTLPNCNLMHIAGTTLAQYDGALRATGRWSYMCEAHFTQFGAGLGTGIGQKLILRDSAEHKAIQAEKAQQPKPDVESLLRAAVMGDTVETSDGCEVEPDGKCPHGLLSPLRELGLI